jgi:hypothetical protein
MENPCGLGPLSPEEVCMKKGIVPFLLLALFFLFNTGGASAQQRSSITVKSGELNNGVIILHIQKAEKAYQLQCNQGASNCTMLNAGKYLMVELPENFGMYECKDVEVYPDSSAGPGKDTKIGEYCLIEK